MHYVAEHWPTLLANLVTAAFLAWFVKTRRNGQREEARDFEWTKPAAAE